MRGDGLCNQAADLEEGLVTRFADDPSGAGIDVDPDNPAIVHELHPQILPAKFRPQIIGAAHTRQYLPLDLRQGHRTPLLLVAECTVLIPRPVEPGQASRFAGMALNRSLLPIAVIAPGKGRGGDRCGGGAKRKDKGTKQAHRLYSHWPDYS